ncbi:hypothetical protein Q7P37_010586 [Cladosporium fusiforme]
MEDSTRPQHDSKKEKSVSVQAGQILEDQSSQQSLPRESPPRQKQKVPWYAYIWDYDPSRSKEEVAFINRLDFGVMTILCLGYFIKNVHQTNMSNAFVSGMREDLQMNSNELNLVDVTWTVGYVIGQVPSQILLTKLRPSIWIPTCQMLWTILTFGLAGITNAQQLIAIRFFIGLFESTFYPAAHMLLGSWYKPSELAKRACIFHASSPAASMFSGYLQAGLYNGLNGVHGLAGWKWLFIADGVPVAIAGFFLIPDLPENCRAFYLKKSHIKIAQRRMQEVGRAPRTKLGWSAWKRIFGRWHVYLLVLAYVVFINATPSSSVHPFTLWLSWTERYSIELINIIPTAQHGIQLVVTVIFAIFSDHWRNRPALMSVGTFFGLFMSAILAVRGSGTGMPDGLLWFAHLMYRVYVPYGPLSMTWANEICSADAEERSIVIGMMNASGYAFNAWLPFLTFPAVDGPFFYKGFVWGSCMFVVQFGVTYSVWYMQRRDQRRKEVAEQAVSIDLGE